MVATEPEMGKLYNRIFSLDDRLWEELEKKPIPDVEQNTLIKFDRTEGVYIIPFLNRIYHVDPLGKTVSLGGKTFASNEKFQLQLVVVSYLAHGSGIPLTGEMVNEKGLKGGTLFFQGPHTLRREPILERYGEDPDGFRELGKRFNGSPMDFGDASFTVRVLPKIPVGFILYCKDEEFPADLVVTFDKSIESHFKLDVIWALVNVTVGQFMAQS
jgi:hypothetical protein